MFYSDWCFTCLRVEPIWAKLTEELEPGGFGIVTVHAGKERELARKIGSNELPHIGLLMDGKIVHYKDPQFSALRVLEFVRNKLPWKLVETIDDGNVDSFLKGWSDNRIRVLLFGKTDVIRLRYLTTAFKYRSRAKLGKYFILALFVSVWRFLKSCIWQHLYDSNVSGKLQNEMFCNFRLCSHWKFAYQENHKQIQHC